MAARVLSVDGAVQRGNGVVVAVARSGTHSFSKPPCDAIRLVAGLGVDGDAHLGSTVKHRSHVRRDPTMPNLRQVHLIHAELFEELRGKGFALSPGDIGENVTTRGIDLLTLPAGARLRLGASAFIEITGLRNPCLQLDRFMPGLMAATLDRDADGNLIRKAGVMAIVLRDGEVRSGDIIEINMPPHPHHLLAPV
jgi:MOSC domain-containing protein YiiM